MTSSNRLRAKLKAASRRRKRRDLNRESRSTDQGSQVSIDTGFESGSGPELDIPRILIDAVLRLSQRNGSLRDSAVIAALKAVATQIPPNSEEAKLLFRQMDHDLMAHGIDSGQREAAASELLEIASANRSSDSPDQLIRYFDLIAA